MIKLSEETRDIIAFAIKYCNLVDIDALMIDKKGIRAKQDDKAVYLIQPGDFDFLEFDVLYTTRVKDLFPRFKMFETSKIDYTIAAEVKDLQDGTNIVSKLVIKGKNTTVNFNTSMITANNNLPRHMKDPLHYQLQVQSEDLQLLKKGVSAMGAEEFKIYSEDDSVYCKIKDIEGDELTQKLASSFKILEDDADDDFDVLYNFKIIFPLLNEAGRENESFIIKITRKGIMMLKINGLSMYIFPEID